MKKKTTLKVVKKVDACRNKKGCTLTSWETMTGKTFESKLAA